MKYLLAFALALLCTLSGSSYAQPVTGPYVSLGAGVDFLLNQKAPASPGLRIGQSTLAFSPGFAGQGSIGYGLGNGLRAEIEGNYFNDHVKSISPETQPGGHEQQYGGMLNVLYDFDVGAMAFPYVGVGAGGQIVELDNLTARTTAGTVSPATSKSSFSDFGYQGIAGVAFPIVYVPGLSVTAEYRFMGLLDPAQAVSATKVAAGGVTTAAGNLKLENIYHNSAMLGLRYAFNTAAPAPEPGPAPVAAPAPQAARTYLVFFDWDRADLTIRAKTIIREAATASTRVNLTRIAVNGYTDLSGTAAYNQKLSVRRAESVAAELVRDGVPRAVISIQGFGESNPLVPTAAGVREPQNRRVEIILQ